MRRSIARESSCAILKNRHGYKEADSHIYFCESASQFQEKTHFIPCRKCQVNVHRMPEREMSL